MPNDKSQTTLEERVARLEKSLGALLHETIALTVEYNKTLDIISGLQSQILILKGVPQ